jgi:diguanylate cyclase (GGDEF)-like protein/PAS domain S-box-containing protein
MIKPFIQPFVTYHKVTKPGLIKAIFFALFALALQLGSFYSGKVNVHHVDVYAMPIALWSAILFFAGPQYWPVLLVTSFLGLTVFDTPVITAATYSASLTLITFTIVNLDQAFYKRPLAIETLPDIFRIALCSVAVGICATLILLLGNLTLGAEAPDITLQSWLFVFERATLRCFLVFPLLIIWSTLPKGWFSRDNSLKLLFFMTVWCVIAFLMFFAPQTEGSHLFSRGYLIFVLTPFVGLYLGAHGVTLSTALIYIFAMWASFSTTGGFYESGNIDFFQLRIFLVCHAVTGLITIIVIELLKKQKERYTTTEEVFLKAIEEIPIPIAVMSLRLTSEAPTTDTRMEYVNSSFVNATGYARDQLPNLGTWWRLAYPDQAYRNWVINRWKAWSTNDDTPPNLESWVQCRDGSKKLIRWSSFSLGDRVLSYGMDQTLLNQQQNSLKIAASLYQAIGAMVAMTDESNKIIAVNPAFQHELGYSEQELLGLGITSFVSFDSESDAFKTIWEQLRHQDHFEGETQVQPRGRPALIRHMSVYTSPSPDTDRLQRIWLFSEPTDAKKARTQIQRQAQYDPLTGLANRRLFMTRLETAISTSSRNQSKFCLIFIDLDDFKDINDTRGHDIGDGVLIAVAKRLQRLQRPTDTTARLGGDEFTLIYSNIESDHELEKRVDVLLKEFEQPLDINNTRYQISISVGVAQYPRDGQTTRDILMHADQAMYAAKREGKGRHRQFDQSLQQQANEKQEAISEIKRALENQEFELYFQPILSLSTQQIVKAEALLRWNQPDRSMRMPTTFLRHAESSGLIVPLGAWVFTQAVEACQQFTRIQPDFSVSVNVSAAQMNAREDHTLAWIQELSDRKLDPGRISLEITEQVMLRPTAAVRARIERLRQAGFQFSIDDFGVGFSSLAALQDTQFNYLKIDRHFISTLDTTPESQAVVRAIIELAHGLNMQAIAEGIETQAQLEILQQLGCDLGQGYLLHRPMKHNQLDELLKTYASEALVSSS